MIQARQRVANSMEALRLELGAGGGAAGPRYASWPVGAAVEVSPTVSQQLSNVPGASPDQGVGAIPAKLVRFDAEQNTFEVEYYDGSRQVLPVHKVQRAGR